MREEGGDVVKIQRTRFLIWKIRGLALPRFKEKMRGIQVGIIPIRRAIYSPRSFLSRASFQPDSARGARHIIAHRALHT